jgi:hypothetical protein
LVEISMCLPGSNASVERVFSAVNMIWTSQWSRLCLQTVKSMLSVLINFPMTCQQFAAKLGSRQDILKKNTHLKNTIDLVCITELLYFVVV